MTQLYLDFDGGPRPAPPPPRDGSDACVLVRELERIARERGRGRKVLVARTRGEGKELLRQVALRGQSWVGFEVTTARPLAMRIAAGGLAGTGCKVIDAFDEQALVEQAIDEALLTGPLSGSRSRFPALAEKVGFRDAVRHSVAALRLGGIRASAVRAATPRPSGRQQLVAAVLGRFEALLLADNLADTATVLATATGILDDDTATPALEAATFLIPGLSDRGLAGRFVRALQRRGAVILKTDPVEGLHVPKGILWDVAPPEAPGSYLHAVERRDEHGSSQNRPRIELFAAGSVYDELRGVLRRVMEAGARWDEVEIIASDPALYGSALHALADPLGIPVTFAVGLPVERTRPGRVVATWFKWIESDFQEALFRALVEAGDVSPPPAHDGIAGPRLARALRRLRIGWGRARYLARIERELRDLPSRQARGSQSEESFGRWQKRTEADLRALKALLGPVLHATPDVARRVSPAHVAAGVKSLLARVADGTDTDDTARERLSRILDRIEATLDRLTDFASAAAIVKSLLAIRIPAPRTEGTAPWSSAAGHLYLTDLSHGGASGRPFTFIVGLDSGSFPGSTREDPLLLDRERLRLGQGELPFASDRTAEARFHLAQLVARHRGTLVLSYARWDPSEARALSPAPELLQALRLREGDRTLDFEDLNAHLGMSESRLPRPDLRADLDAGDVWLRALATDDGRLRDGLSAVGRASSRLSRGMAAAEALLDDTATVDTGILGTRSPPLSYQDLPNRVLSASRLEQLGACPRRFLFNVVLGVSPPDDPEFDPHRWLNALQRGSLLHDVYERTLGQARERGLEPDGDGFLALALTLTDREVAKQRRLVPSPSQVVRDIEISALRDDVRSFVEMIRSSLPRWTELEMPFGMDDDGIEIEGTGGNTVLVRGRVDRVDDYGTHLRVIDYKTGTDFGHDHKSGVYRGGRRLQHALYTAAVTAVRGRPVDRMEYHFPTRRGENRVRAYATSDLRHGGALIAALIEGAAAGWFPATDDSGDCRFCDFQEVCGVEPVEWGKPSCRFAEWTARNLDTVPELSVLKRARNWEDEEPIS